MPKQKTNSDELHMTKEGRKAAKAEKRRLRRSAWADEDLREIDICKGVTIDRSVYQIGENRYITLIIKGFIVYLITAGGIGFLTWEDMATHKFNIKRYRMQSKTILTAGVFMVLAPMVLLFFTDFSGMPFRERICLALFQSVTPRTAGFNTADLTKMTGPGLLITGMLMLIGGAPGSTAGGMKTTTAAVLFNNSLSVIRRKKAVRMFSRRVEDSAVKTAAALLLMYLTLVTAGAIIISIAEGLPLRDCLFETASAIGTVGLTLGITPGLGGLSRTVLEILMFFGRVGGLTIMYAAISSRETEVSQYPVEKITVG